MLVLPGPGTLVTLAGLAVLATEFAWAERTLDRTTTRAAKATTALTATRTGQVAFALCAGSLILGGGTVAVLIDGYRLAGVTALSAGVGALAVVVPATRRLMNLAPGPAPCAGPADDSTRRTALPVPEGESDPTRTKGSPT